MLSRMKAALAFVAAVSAAAVAFADAPPPPASVPAAPAAPATETAAPDATGLWTGQIVVKPGEVEVDLTVELARAADGRLVGTIDIPGRRIEFHPLDDLRQEGRKVAFVFNWYNREIEQQEATPFSGALSEDGRTLAGEMNDGGTIVAFSLRRLGEAGMERPAVREQPLVGLAGSGAELRAAFNRDAGHPRLVLLLSPT